MTAPIKPLSKEQNTTYQAALAESQNTVPGSLNTTVLSYGDRQAIDNMGGIDIVSSALGTNTLGTPLTTRLSYPTKIATTEQPHWLSIKIRVRKQAVTTLGLGKNVQKDYVEEETKGKRIPATQEGLGNLTALATGAAAAGATAKLAAKIAGEDFGAAAGVLGGAAGLGLGGANGAVYAYTEPANGIVTLATTIGLGLQAPPSITYSTTWEAMDFGQMVVTGKLNAEIAQEAIRNASSGIKGAAADAAGINNVGDAARKALGKIRNPYREQIFKQVEFRELAFNYKFLPESIAEAKTVMQIIRNLKQHMLPTFDPQGYYLIYPSEFSLEYMYKDSSNIHVNKILDCVLTNMNVTYGEGDFTTFRETHGMPSEIIMTLTFKEIVTLTSNQTQKSNY